MLSQVDIAALVDECFADDIELPGDVATWDSAELRAYLESGGSVRPALRPAPEPTPVIAAEPKSPSRTALGETTSANVPQPKQTSAPAKVPIADESKHPKQQNFFSSALGFFSNRK